MVKVFILSTLLAWHSVVFAGKFNIVAIPGLNLHLNELIKTNPKAKPDKTFVRGDYCDLECDKNRIAKELTGRIWDIDESSSQALINLGLYIFRQEPDMSFRGRIMGTFDVIIDGKLDNKGGGTWSVIYNYQRNIFVLELRYTYNNNNGVQPYWIICPKNETPLTFIYVSVYGTDNAMLEFFPTP